MTITPLQLAALVSAGIPGLYPVAALPAPDSSTYDYDSAIILDSTNKRWLVRAPKSPEASVRLEAEHVILQSFTPGLRARLPFLLPTIAGTVPLAGSQAFIYSYTPGSRLSIDQLNQLAHQSLGKADGLASQLAHSIATIHALPSSLIEEADLPLYTGQHIQERRQAELSLALSTGHLPAQLSRRWTQLFENPDLWQFRPRCIHGDLNEDQLLIDQKKLVEISGWSSLCLGDPAQDFAWLYACESTALRDQVFDLYRKAMPQEPDRNLETRASLYAEFSLAQWLIRGLELEDQAMIDEAVSLLQGLEEDLLAAQPLPGLGNETL
ncbi:MAG: phosphotransferase [Rothia sp. (in: high G+C Gram-positive bacteria)]|nr:phosphotransferase [Rothia sp. (in: high G+C Gram-positive bacteria)]